jgi:hypothetical protein
MNWGFHEGELAVQREAGVLTEARRLQRMLAPPDLSGGAAKFLAVQSYAVLTARDAAGVLWTSPLAASPGFLDARGDTLRVGTVPRREDPLWGLPTGQQIGLIAIDFHARRRMRINGTLATADTGAGLVIAVDQAYGNCPQYIHDHDLDAAMAASRSGSQVDHGDEFTSSARELITAVDTFFLGTTHPTRGSDASHRGGPPGFVRVTSPTQLWWPDYLGNNMFNSLGNLAVDDEAALLFTDYGTGDTVQASGTARVEWTDPGVPGDDGGVGRRVAFTASAVAAVVTAQR